MLDVGVGQNRHHRIEISDAMVDILDSGIESLGIIDELNFERLQMLDGGVGFDPSLPPSVNPKRQ